MQDYVLFSFYFCFLCFRDGKKAEKQENIGFDEILEHIGGWGLFQWRLLGIFIFNSFMLAYVGYSPILYTYVPDHWCEIPENVTELFGLKSETELIELLIPIDENTNTRSQCKMFEPQALLENLDIVNKSNIPTIKCIYGHHYNFTGYFKSISTNVSTSFTFFLIFRFQNLHHLKL